MAVLSISVLSSSKRFFAIWKAPRWVSFEREVLHLIFQLQRYVDFHNCFKIFVKLERVYTPKCYVFVAKWDISGIVRYGSWKVNFILICVDRPKRPCTRFSPTTDWFFYFGDKKLSRILLNKETGTYLSICHCFTLLIYEKLICK